jgi:hypothetical protein
MLAVLGAPSVPGCDPAGPAEPSSPAAAAVARATVDRPQPAATPAPRGRLIAGERVERIPRWPASSAIDAEVWARLPTAARDAASDSPVPVLVPHEARRINADQR